MKKQVAGFIAGAIFTLSATAFADDIQNLIGKTVQAQYTVEINGQTLNTVVVEGKNYAPVRSIGEAAGYEVINDGKKVILKEGEKLDTTAVKEKYRLEKIEGLKNALTNANNKVQETKDFIAAKKIEAGNVTTDKEKTDYANIISRYELQLSQYEKSVKDIEDNLAKLQAEG
ncbi:hypothetical protein NST58_01805 [Paenibacillus sp. FSL R10-2796]|uniref:hypothetical protein n=1 Tax=Paenibacillus sp. FSL R10-2796 TaxID=2954663 RepID=UPI0030D7EA75